MAGVGIKIRPQDQTANQAMARLAAQPSLVQPALKNIGVALVRSTRQRFADQKDPQGQPWKPLNPEYAKAKGGGKILQKLGMRGGLLGSIVWQLEGSTLQIGTNKIQAAVHQFGAVILPRNAPALVFRIGKKLIFAAEVTIPARPYLGISADDRTEIAEIVEDHVNQVWKG